MGAAHHELAKAARVPVDRIRVHPRNIRSKLTRIETLSRSIRAEGVLQPLVVHRKFRRGDGVQDLELIAGHRRLAAAELAGLSHVPCIVLPQMTDDEAILAMLGENTQRRAVPGADLARAIRTLRTEFDYSTDVIAERLGITPAEVQALASGTARDDETPDVAAVRADDRARPAPAYRPAPRVHRQALSTPTIGAKRVHGLLAEHDAGDLAATDVVARLRGALGGWAPTGATAVVGPPPELAAAPTPADERDDDRGPLTEREQQVLRHMANGRSNGEIGRQLYLSEDTVKTHARRLFRKLGARDRAHAVALGISAGLITLPPNATPAVASIGGAA